MLRNMPRLVSILLLPALVVVVTANPNGAPPKACNSLKPEHGFDVQPHTTFPAVGTVSKKSIRPGESVEFTISGKTKSDTFQGFMVQARVGSTIVGEFRKADNVKLVDCQNSARNSATHTSPDEKASITLTWVSPAKLSEAVDFHVTIAKNGKTYWVDKILGTVTVSEKN